MFAHSTLSRSPEFRRIKELPKRTWGPVASEKLADQYTKLLKTPKGTWTLRPIQGVALHEIATVGGLVGPLRVGSGKTLITLLCARLLNARRPLLLMPAALVEKTKRERMELMHHWQIPMNINIYSYNMLSREGQANYLENMQPDLIIADECHLLKNLRAGVTRRVRRYMENHPETMFVATSGTLLKDDIRDFAHLSEWALKDGSPMPLEKGELMEWAELLGKKQNPLHRVHPGPLLEFATKEDQSEDELTTARQGFRRRLLETPGVVSSGGDAVSCSLYIEAVDYPVNETTEANFKLLRECWETPDGWTFSEAVQLWRHARELAIGFHGIWLPRPPDNWINARRNWAAYVREVLSHSHTLDTELQVAREHEDSEEWRMWDQVRGEFKINSQAVWHDDGALNFCEKWMKQGPGIVWTEHVFFGRELAKRTGVSYFGEGGTDSEGNPIESADAKSCVIASVRANSTGRNLQKWSRNLITSPSSDTVWEQLLGRTHRDGQTADTVTADCMLTCREHFDAMVRAIEGAKVHQSVMGHEQKILLADIVLPSEEEIEKLSLESVRWRGSRNK